MISQEECDPFGKVIPAMKHLSKAIEQVSEQKSSHEEIIKLTNDLEQGFRNLVLDIDKSNASTDTKRCIWKILVDIRIALAVFSQNLSDLKLRQKDIPTPDLASGFIILKSGTDALIELNTPFIIEGWQHFLTTLKEMDIIFNCNCPSKQCK